MMGFKSEGTNMEVGDIENKSLRNINIAVLVLIHIKDQENIRVPNRVEILLCGLEVFIMVKSNYFAFERNNEMLSKT